MSKLITQIIDDNLKDPEFEPINYLLQGKFVYRKTTRQKLSKIVLIPGYMCDKNIWDAQISILKKKYSVSIPSPKKSLRHIQTQ